MNGIRNLRDLSRGDVKLFGGKAAHLGELIGLGLRVPPGFCVGHKTISALLAKDSLGDEHKKLMEAIRPYFNRLTEDLSNGHGLLAVRSSASGEDSAVASFAGQFETVLGVRTLPELCAAMLICWNSSHSNRAMSYARKQGLSVTPMSVIVQRLVLPEAAGVCFTCHPISLEANIVVIEANWGFGDAVVAGLVSPDHFEVDTVAGTIRVRQIARKRRMSKLVSQKVELVNTPDDQQCEPCLTDEDLWKITDAALSVQRHFGCPQDIEWALTKDQLYVVQSRPITGGIGAEQGEVGRLYV